MSELQAIAFYKLPYGSWTKDKAEKWMNKHGYNPIKEAHETKNMLHYRLSDPSKRFKSFISKQVGKKSKKILLTIGILKGVNGQKKKHIFMGGDLHTAHEFQEVFPLSKESGILDKQIVPIAESNRSMNPDMITIRDSKTDDIERVIYNHQMQEQKSSSFLIPNFAPNTLLGALMLSREKGGLGFPYPTSAGTYSPKDWISLSRA